MATIDNILFEKAGAEDCSDSDCNLAITNCCRTYLVKDEELDNLFFDPKDLSKVLRINEQERCPNCQAEEWNYSVFPEWPRERTPWIWAYHPNQQLVEDWINGAPG